MRAAILGARRDMDSLGGMIESVTTGLPVGLGEPVFGSLESDISSGVFSIPSVKGVEFGSGFAGSESTGSQNNDTFVLRDGAVQTRNQQRRGHLGRHLHRDAADPEGGLQAGLLHSQGAAHRGTSSQARMRCSASRGRHDPCVVPRAPPVVDSVVALVLADHALLGGFIGPVFVACRR